LNLGVHVTSFVFDLGRDYHYVPNILSVLRIRLGLGAVPYPDFYLNADPDPGSQTNADPDPDQSLPSKNVEILHEKENNLCDRS
jgi:hypothetical protein